MNLYNAFVIRNLKKNAKIRCWEVGKLIKIDMEEAVGRVHVKSIENPHRSLISTISLKSLPFGFGKSVALHTLSRSITGIY